MPDDQWRLLITSPAPGDWNMAVDEYLMQAAITENGNPTLRLYSWDPPCLSLGFAQPITDVDFSGLTTLGWTLVRRPTGGKAILHTDELTYSITASAQHHLMVGGVLESYQRISIILLLALKKMGVDASSKERGSRGETQQNPVCFEVPSNYEITVDGKKIIGSAQSRRAGSVLQHGSLPLFGDITRITQSLIFLTDQERQTAASRLLEHATTMKSVLGRSIDMVEAVQAFQDAFSETLNVNLEQKALSSEEKRFVEEIRITKYASEQWTRRV